jgi:hypothetical protein
MLARLAGAPSGGVAWRVMDGCAYLTGPNLPNRSNSSSVLTV